MITDILVDILTTNSIITAFIFVGLLTAISYKFSAHFTKGYFHGSAIAIILGLIAAYMGGFITNGDNGIADIGVFSGVGILGGAMFRDFAIVATAFGADLKALKNAGFIAAASVVIGVILSFFVGAFVAIAFGYNDAISITTIGAGAATYIVGPVTGTALSAGSEVIALSVAAGLTKSIIVMVGTPIIASRVGLNNPHSALMEVFLQQTLN